MMKAAGSLRQRTVLAFATNPTCVAKAVRHLVCTPSLRPVSCRFLSVSGRSYTTAASAVDTEWSTFANSSSPPPSTSPSPSLSPSAAAETTLPTSPSSVAAAEAAATAATHTSTSDTSPPIPNAPQSGPNLSPQNRRPPGVVGSWATRADFDSSLPTGLAVTWLGTSSGRPTPNRNVSCTVVRMPDTLLLVDCGEGALRQLEATGLDMATIERIFITHLHGDHVFGLPGLLRRLSSIKAHLPEEQRHVYVYGPPGLVELIRVTFGVKGMQLQVPLTVTEFVSSKLAHCEARPLDRLHNVFQCQQGPDVAPLVPQMKTMEELAGARYGPSLRVMRRPKRLNPRAFDNVSVQPQPDQAWYVRCNNGALVGAAQLLHRVPCWGYAMYEPPPGPKTPPRKVVILGDTMNSTAIAPLAWGADILSHEATFAEGMERKAYEALHSTAWMAGLFARSVEARQLVLTHFSSRYDVIEPDYPGSMRGRKPGHSEDEDDAFVNVNSDEIEQLLDEAKAAYGKDTVCAASDFFTFHVPPSNQGT